MGNIKSFCCRDNVSVADDREERERILNDNCNSNNSPLRDSSNSIRDDLSYGSLNNGTGNGIGSSGGKTMEQSALDKIYQKMAANVIDVAPGESMVIQPAEFIERQKAYQSRLDQIRTPLPLRSNTAKIPRNLNNPLLDTSSALTRINTSISTSGTNLTRLNQLNNSSATVSGDQSNINSSQTGNSVSTSKTPNTSSSGYSPGHLSMVQEKRRVEYEPISVDEIQLINEISLRTVKAIQGLKVASSEPVVTCFKP